MAFETRSAKVRHAVVVLDQSPFELAGATAVVTGAAAGIGAGMARAAAARGMTVVLADRDPAGIASIAEELTAAGHRAVVVPTDVADLDAVERLAAVAFDRPEPVRLLVNNAGIEQVSLLWEGSRTAWRDLIDVNLHGTYHGIRAFVPRLISQGEPAGILNVSSIAALTSGAYQGAYQVSKRAVLALSECLVSDLSAVDAPIRVGVAFPGAVNTAIFAKLQRAADDPDAVVALDLLRGVLQDGLDPDDAGASIFESFTMGRRWITTHADMLRTFARHQAGGLARITEEATRPLADGP